MKKNKIHEDQENDAEILKAVAQAWHGHSSSSKIESTSEFDVHRLYFKGKPTRFKMEALRMAAIENQCGMKWDFRQSLWDSYEIVNVSKKLERCLNLDDPFSAFNHVSVHRIKRLKESKNSLRKLFEKLSSRRLSDDDVVLEGDLSWQKHQLSSGTKGQGSSHKRNMVTAFSESAATQSSASL